MKLDKKLKIALIILLIILISIISFAGIYVQDKNRMINILADYKLGMDLQGGRVITIAVNTGTETVYYDKDGNIVDEEAKDGTKKEIAINSEESLTKENYIKTKEIIEKRLNDFGISDYLIRQDESTGKITIQVPEDSNTDLAIQYIYTIGEFTVIGENEEVLLNNSNIKEAKVVYGSTDSGTQVYLNIEFNKDCIEKIKEISKTYVASTDEEGKDNTKKITMNIDGSSLVSTSFEEEISNGVLSISVGNATTSNDDINTYLKQASNLAILLNNESFPLEYKIEANRYVSSDITIRDFVITGLVAGIVLLVAVVVMSVLYKKNGILVGIANIGYIAVLLILIRYTNVIITTEGMLGILVSAVLNYVFSIYLLKLMKEESISTKIAYNKTVLAMLFILIPSLILSVTMCFTNWMPIYSFGEIIFWGTLTIFVYNTILTRTLLICSTKNQ